MVIEYSYQMSTEKGYSSNLAKRESLVNLNSIFTGRIVVQFLLKEISAALNNLDYHAPRSSRNFSVSLCRAFEHDAKCIPIIDIFFTVQTRNLWNQNCDVANFHRRLPIFLMPIMLKKHKYVVY